VLYLFHATHFITTYFSSVTTQGTLVGSWVDFAYFVIFTFLLGLLLYEVLAPKGIFKYLSLISMVLSLIVLIFLNFKAAWVITIVSALLVFVYKSSVERSLSNDHEEVAGSSKPFPLMSFVALLVGLFFFLSSASIGVSLSHAANISFTDIRPSFATTMHVMRATLDHDPIFGSGAGNYGNMWNLYHPTAINSTLFWNTSFDTGYNFILSSLTTNGVLPVLFLLIALGIAIVHGFTLFSYQFPDRFSRFIAVTSVIMLVAFVCLILFASPGLVLIFFGFTYLGLLLGVSTLVGRTKILEADYLQDPRSSFFAILIIVVAAMAGFSAVYFSGNRFASIVYYNQAIAANSVESAQALLDKAIALSPNDVYWTTRTTLFTNEFRNAASVTTPDKAQLQTIFSQAETSAQSAVAWDNGSANNWLTLSQVYQLIANTQNATAYENAKQAADKAESLNPNNPVYRLNEAQLALTKQDTGTAYNYIAQALSLKPDYLDAYVLKAQIEIAQGNANAGVTEMTAYTSIAPYDDQGFLLLGQAELQLKNYSAAVTAIGEAVSLAPTSENDYVQYIQALELAGDKSQAIAVLKQFKRLFPSVQGVDAQIAQLQTTSTNAVAPATAPAKKKK
jgi:DNA-binding SARP family transcriptional activator